MQIVDKEVSDETKEVGTAAVRRAARRSQQAQSAGRGAPGGRLARLRPASGRLLPGVGRRPDPDPAVAPVHRRRRRRLPVDDGRRRPAEPRHRDRPRRPDLGRALLHQARHVLGRRALTRPGRHARHPGRRLRPRRAARHLGHRPPGGPRRHPGHVPRPAVGQVPGRRPPHGHPAGLPRIPAVLQHRPVRQGGPARRQGQADRPGLARGLSGRGARSGRGHRRPGHVLRLHRRRGAGLPHVLGPVRPDGGHLHAHPGAAGADRPRRRYRGRAAGEGHARRRDRRARPGLRGRRRLLLHRAHGHHLHGQLGAAVLPQGGRPLRCHAHARRLRHPGLLRRLPRLRAPPPGERR